MGLLQVWFALLVVFLFILCPEVYVLFYTFTLPSVGLKQTIRRNRLNLQN